MCFLQFSYGDLYFWLLMDTLSDEEEPTFKGLLVRGQIISFNK